MPVCFEMRRAAHACGVWTGPTHRCGLWICFTSMAHNLHPCFPAASASMEGWDEPVVFKLFIVSSAPLGTSASYMKTDLQWLHQTMCMHMMVTLKDRWLRSAGEFGREAWNQMGSSGKYLLKWSRFDFCKLLIETRLRPARWPAQPTNRACPVQIYSPSP